MSDNFLILEKELVTPDSTFMIAGFENQWANAGNVSGGVPEYLIGKLNPRKVGNIHKDSFYISQLPGLHHMFRPFVKYVEGYEESYQKEPKNDFYYVEINGKGLILFSGTEPQMDIDGYVNTLLDGAKELGIKRIIIPEGVGWEVPFDRERRISCTYSLRHMREELEGYALTFADYDMTATIGMTVNHYAMERGMEFVRMSARVPSYHIPIEIMNDRRAIFDILRRANHMFGLNLDLSDLETESDKQTSEWEYQLKRLYEANPHIANNIAKYMEEIREKFEEKPFEEPVEVPDSIAREFRDLV